MTVDVDGWSVDRRCNGARHDATTGRYDRTSSGIDPTFERLNPPSAAWFKSHDPPSPSSTNTDTRASVWLKPSHVEVMIDACISNSFPTYLQDRNEAIVSLI